MIGSKRMQTDLLRRSVKGDALLESRQPTADYQRRDAAHDLLQMLQQL